MQWLLVYICEAHASDEWPIGSHVQIKQHTNTQERLAACQTCCDALGVSFPTVLDSEANAFNNAYAAWPLRFYLIDNNRVEHVPMPTNGAYDPNELDTWLQTKVPAPLPGAGARAAPMRCN